MRDEAPVGLTGEDARQRLARDGPNELAADRGRAPLRILFAQVRNPLVPVLVAAAIVSRVLGEGIESTVIVTIVVVNALLGFVQEYRAERAVQALRMLVARTARVVRDGVLVEVPVRELVRGDLVELEVGDLVPADLTLVESAGLTTNEAVLTGESAPVSKAAGDLAGMGVEVAGGYGRGVVVATGTATVLGRTSALLAAKPDETDFQRNMRRLSSFLVRIMTVLTLFVFIVNTIGGRGWFEAFLFAVALAVGMTPEVLPAIVTIALGRAAMRMARDRIVVKRLMSVEDLGNMDTLCCDKTGTLTQGVFTLTDAVDPDGRPDTRVLLLAAVAASSGRESVSAPAPNATDRAIWAAPGLQPILPSLAAYRVVARQPIDFVRRRTVVVADGPQGRVMVVKGAPDSLLPDCASMGGHALAVASDWRRALLDQVARYEEDGLRVIALGTKPFAGTADASAESGFTLAGFLLLRDPPKHGVLEVLDRFEQLGVAIKVLSGDSVAVTHRICKDVQLEAIEGGIVDGRELDGYSDEQFRESVLSHAVFARVTPEQKYRLVAALRGAGHVVGFLGDGVNDAPALRAADVGISVDSGADVAKDAADVVMLEKDLMVIASGIEEGRRTFANITKYLLNTLSANFGNMATVAASSAFLSFIPMLPSQILLNNLLSDLPLVTIATDRVDPAMLHRPRRWSLRSIGQFMVIFGLLSAAFDALLIAILLRRSAPVPLFRTAWFVESAVSEIIVTFAIRTRVAFFRSRPAPALLWTSVATIAVVFLLPVLTVGREWFQFVPLAGVLLPVVGVLLTYFASAELVKRWFFARIDL